MPTLRTTGRANMASMRIFSEHYYVTDITDLYTRKSSENYQYAFNVILDSLKDIVSHGDPVRWYSQSIFSSNSCEYGFEQSAEFAGLKKWGNPFDNYPPGDVRDVVTCKPFEGITSVEGKRNY